MISAVRKLLRQLATYQVPVYAANSSFFIMLSILPLGALVVTSLQFLPITYEDLLLMIGRVIPGEIMPLVDRILFETFQANATAIISVTGVIALWSASRGVYGIITGLNAIYGDREIRPYLRRRITASIYTVVLLIALVLTLSILVFGQSLGEFLEIALAGIPLASALIATVLELRFLFTIGFLTIMFTLIFAVFPARKVAVRHAVPGAVLSSVGWVLFSQLFSIYVEHGGGSRFYGSMTILILFMLWLYTCMSILFYGGVLCSLCANGLATRKNLTKFLEDGGKI